MKIKRMIKAKYQKILLVSTFLMVMASVFVFFVLSSSKIPRRPFVTPNASYKNWDDILSHPKQITIQAYSTGIMQTPVSGIVNLKNEKAKDIQDKIVEVPVTVAVVHHQEYGSYLIDAGLDSSYTHNPYGNMRGIMVKRFLGKGKQEPNTDIASILKNENIHIRGVFLTHLHFDHTAGIVDLPKNISYVVGKDEIYTNFRFFMQSDHLAGLEYLYEIDCSEGIDLPPFGKSIDLFGDGSLWAISSSGHSKGHVMYFVNGVDEKVLVTGDACNNQYQFDIEIGPGYFSSDVDQAQKVLNSIKIFKKAYPEIKLVFGHDI